MNDNLTDGPRPGKGKIDPTIEKFLRDAVRELEQRFVSQLAKRLHPGFDPNRWYTLSELTTDLRVSPGTIKLWENNGLKHADAGMEEHRFWGGDIHEIWLKSRDNPIVSERTLNRRKSRKSKK